MAKDLLDKTGLTYLATKFQEWCEGLFVKKDTEYKDVYASDRGVKVSIGGTIGSPIISVQTTVGEISEINSSVVSGEMVKAYVDANKGVNTVFKAQTNSSNAVNGLVPAPSSANTQKYLRGDGTWSTYGTATSTSNGLMSSEMASLIHPNLWSGAKGLGDNTHENFIYIYGKGSTCYFRSSKKDSSGNAITYTMINDGNIETYTSGDSYKLGGVAAADYATKLDITDGNITAAKATTADSANAIGGKGLHDLVQGDGTIKFIKAVTSLPASPSNDTLYLIKQ